MKCSSRGRNVRLTGELLDVCECASFPRCIAKHSAAIESNLYSPVKSSSLTDSVSEAPAALRDTSITPSGSNSTAPVECGDFAKKLAVALLTTSDW